MNCVKVDEVSNTHDMSVNLSINRVVNQFVDQSRSLHLSQRGGVGNSFKGNGGGGTSRR